MIAINKRILVAGSANMDVVISLARVPERGETVVSESQRFVPGGKGANRAVALARLGANPVFSCVLGDDAWGNTLFDLYASEGMSTNMIGRTSLTGTGAAYIFVEGDGSNRIAIYPGANQFFDTEKATQTAAKMGEISILSLECEIPVPSVERLIFEAARAGVPAVVDAAPVKADAPLEVFSGAYILSPNESEAFALTGIRIEDNKTAKEACRVLYGAGIKYALIKLGDKGSVCYDGADYIFCPPFTMAGAAVDTTAAGDSYMAGLCFALWKGLTMEQAMRYGSVAAGISVTRRGAVPSLPLAGEVKDFIAKYPAQSGLNSEIIP